MSTEPPNPLTPIPDPTNGSISGCSGCELPAQTLLAIQRFIESAGGVENARRALEALRSLDSAA